MKNRYDRLDVVLLSGIYFCLGVILAILLPLPPVHAQKAERGTQHWTITVPATFTVGEGTIHVFDMTGVCLYVSNTGALSAVPKTQLPAGTGCQ